MSPLPEVVEWCEEAKHSSNRHRPTGTKLVYDKAVSRIVHMDGLKINSHDLETAMNEAVPGFSLVIIDMPDVSVIFFLSYDRNMYLHIQRR